MKELSFPIWTIKSILHKCSVNTDKDTLNELIDNFCGIANSNNMGGAKTDSDIALAIGRICIANSKAAEDLKSILTKEKCTEGMLEYLTTFENGILPQLASEDSGSNS